MNPRHRFLIAGLSLFIPLLVLVAVSRAATVEQYDQPEFSQIASSITGQDITVHCVPNMSDKYGYTNMETDENGNVSFDPDIYLGHEICDSLNLMLHHHFQHGKRGKSRFVDDLSFALGRNYMMGVSLLVFVHETEHIRLNSGDEGIVECSAMHRLRSVLRHYFHVPGWLSRIILWSARDAHTQSDPTYLEVC